MTFCSLLEKYEHPEVPKKKCEASTSSNLNDILLPSRQI
ncbi:unnamed protein product [Callosobruchus maculatus]|uniref:Uncharacterized protein n=1 Tax=Callosobruchus maculatus TaxID=64391 RepID=A0A653BR07_CALMS|nr:unnamed protein product [Callosobruchus maculatus]